MPSVDLREVPRPAAPKLLDALDQLVRPLPASGDTGKPPLRPSGPEPLKLLQLTRGNQGHHRLAVACNDDRLSRLCGPDPVCEVGFDFCDGCTLGHDSSKTGQMDHIVLFSRRPPVHATITLPWPLPSPPRSLIRSPFLATSFPAPAPRCSPACRREAPPIWTRSSAGSSTRRARR